MKLTSKLEFLSVCLLLVSAVVIGLAWWGTRTTQVHIERINYAHQALEAHLSLSNHTYQLFKQYGDALTIGDRDKGAGERQLIQAINQDIDLIRQTIAKEIELVGDEELAELETLAEIERTIQNLITEIEALIEKGIPENFSGDWVRLSQILDNDIDRDFHALITEAIEEERGEVHETEAEVAQEVLHIRILMVVCGLMAVVIAAATLRTLNTQVRTPLKLLSDGVREFGEGDFSRRIALSGNDEISEIGNTFDQMAEQIAVTSADLNKQNTDLEQAVEQRTEQLESVLSDIRAKESQRRRLLADVSHELRTPLTIIQGEADIALRGSAKAPEVYRDALQRSRDAARHTSRLVDDLLFMARAEEGLPKLRIKNFDLRKLIEKTIMQSCPKAIVDLESDKMPLSADEDRIRQVLLVLLENAKVHGGRSVWLRAKSTPSGWWISVEDNGVGLTDEEKVSVFERFYRGSDAATRYADGNGLGLAIVRSIIEAHAGSIELSDRDGGGLVASLTLPRQSLLKAVG